MNGWLIVNGFLQSPKFDDLYRLLADAFRAQGASLTVMPNTAFVRPIGDTLMPNTAFVRPIGDTLTPLKPLRPLTPLMPLMPLMPLTPLRPLKP